MGNLTIGAHMQKPGTMPGEDITLKKIVKEARMNILVDLIMIVILFSVAIILLGMGGINTNLIAMIVIAMIVFIMYFGIISRLDAMIKKDK
jgi:hypothetical protein